MRGACFSLANEKKPISSEVANQNDFRKGVLFGKKGRCALSKGHPAKAKEAICLRALSFHDECSINSLAIERGSL